jgi:hypothetical protein
MGLSDVNVARYPNDNVRPAVDAQRIVWLGSFRGVAKIKPS